MGADQNFFEIRIVGLCPKITQILKRSDPRFGVAIEQLNQHKWSRRNERKHKANRKRIGETAELICQDRSDRSRLFKIKQTGLTGLAYRYDRWHPENLENL